MFTLSTVNCTWLTERLLYRRYLCIKFVYYQLVLSRFKHCSLKLSHVFVCFFVMHFPPKETCRSIVCHTPAVRDTTSLSLNHTVVESCRLFAFNICYLRWSTNRPSRPLHTLRYIYIRNWFCNIVLKFQLPLLKKRQTNVVGCVSQKG